MLTNACIKCIPSKYYSTRMYIHIKVFFIKAYLDCSHKLLKKIMSHVALQFRIKSLDAKIRQNLIFSFLEEIS